MGLFKPAWLGDDEKRAMSAMWKESDQSVLARIVREAPVPAVRQAAARRLTDQATLRDIILDVEGHAYDARKAAACNDNLKDLQILIDIEQRLRDRSDITGIVECATHRAIGRETDQDVLAQFATTTEVGSFAETALESGYLMDEAVLAGIAQHAVCQKARELAANKLVDVMHIGVMNDQATLLKLATTSTLTPIRRAAAARLTDQAALAELVQTDPDSSVRRSAVSQVTDSAVLARVAKTDENEYVRQAAVERISDQALLLDIAMHDRDGLVRYQATVGLSDQSALETLAKIGARVPTVVFYRLLGKLTGRGEAFYEKNSATLRSDLAMICDPDILAGVLRMEWHENVSSEVERRALVAERLAEIAHDQETQRAVAAARQALEDDRELSDHLSYIEAHMRSPEEEDREALFRARRDASRNSASSGRGHAARSSAPSLPFGVDLPPSDLDYVSEALMASQQVTIGGPVSGFLIKTPDNAATAQLLPREGAGFYQIVGIQPGGLSESAWHEVALNRGNPLATFLGKMNLYRGFPALCLKCRHPLTRYELLVGYSRSDSVHNLGRLVLQTSQNDANDIFKALRNDRDFIAIPCCDEHSLRGSFFYAPREPPSRRFFTNDLDVATTCSLYLAPGDGDRSVPSPVSVAQGKIILP